jgi:hypothetical protein
MEIGKEPREPGLKTRFEENLMFVFWSQDQLMEQGLLWALRQAS